MGHVTNRNDSALSSSVILFFSSMSAPCKADIATTHTCVHPSFHRELLRDFTLVSRCSPTLRGHRSLAALRRVVLGLLAWCDQLAKNWSAVTEKMLDLSRLNTLAKKLETA